MAQKLSIDITYMEHSGGTKFYQVFEFRGNDRIATVCHWGKIVGKGDFPRPVNGGQTQVFSRPERRQKIEEKRKRGYNIQDEKCIIYPCDLTIGEDGTFVKPRDWMVDHFGTMTAHEIFTALMLDKPSPTAEGMPKLARETTVLSPKVAIPPVIETRPAAWGSW